MVVLDIDSTERLNVKMAPPSTARLLAPKVQYEIVAFDIAAENRAPPCIRAWLPARVLD